MLVVFYHCFCPSTAKNLHTILVHAAMTGRYHNQCCCEDLLLGLETKTETKTWVFRSRDRDLDKMNLSTLESRDHNTGCITSNW